MISIHEGTVRFGICESMAERGETPQGEGIFRNITGFLFLFPADRFVGLGIACHKTYTFDLKGIIVTEVYHSYPYRRVPLGERGILFKGERFNCILLNAETAGKRKCLRIVTDYGDIYSSPCHIAGEIFRNLSPFRGINLIPWFYRNRYVEVIADGFFFPQTVVKGVSFEEKEKRMRGSRFITARNVVREIFGVRS